MVYQLPVLVNEYLENSIVKGFVTAIFIEIINCVGELPDRHLNAYNTFTVISNFLQIITSTLNYTAYIQHVW